VESRTHNARYRKALVIVSVIVAAGLAIVFSVNPALDRYVDSSGFRNALERETAKGLHFPDFKFGAIRRTGPLNATSDQGIGRDGRKAITSLDAQKITARFNPAGLFLRRWSIDDLHVERAEIGIQVYEPSPEPTPARPWFAFLLPDRVYLNHVWSDHADITWQMRGARAGIFDTRLVITPHGRDFEYQAGGGVLRNPPLPSLGVKKVHLLITKTLFALYGFDVVSGEHGTIHAEGTAATHEDKNLDFKISWNDLTLTEWLPSSWQEHFMGNADGDLQWTGREYKLRSATMRGGLRIKNGRVTKIDFLDQIAVIAGRPGLRSLALKECSGSFVLQKSDCQLTDLVLEEKGKFRIEGEVKISDRSLGGKIDLGLARDYLTWLPHPEEVFPRESGGYRWTTVHLAGTLENPQQDLSPRILEALKGSPSALLGAALRQFGAWLRGE
jgi:hypothetical protein